MIDALLNAGSALSTRYHKRHARGRTPCRDSCHSYVSARRDGQQTHGGAADMLCCRVSRSNSIFSSVIYKGESGLILHARISRIRRTLRRETEKITDAKSLLLPQFRASGFVFGLIQRWWDLLLAEGETCRTTTTRAIALSSGELSLYFSLRFFSL